MILSMATSNARVGHLYCVFVFSDLHLASEQSSKSNNWLLLARYIACMLIREI